MNLLEKLRRRALSIAANSMNLLEKLRRSAMSIAANAPWSSPSSVGASCSFDGTWRAFSSAIVLASTFALIFQCSSASAAQTPHEWLTLKTDHCDLDIKVGEDARLYQRILG